MHSQSVVQLLLPEVVFWLDPEPEPEPELPSSSPLQARAANAMPAVAIQVSAFNFMVPPEGWPGRHLRLASYRQGTPAQVAPRNALFLGGATGRGGMCVLHAPTCLAWTRTTWSGSSRGRWPLDYAPMLSVTSAIAMHAVRSSRIRRGP